MTFAEIRVARKRKRNQIQHAVLGAVAVTGALAVAALAPNALGVLVKMGFIPTRRQKESVARARKNLLKQGLLSHEGGWLRITPQGESLLRFHELKRKPLPRPKRWDQKWRLVIFDIPEHRRSQRSRVRNLLSAMGFVRLQDSVWVYPYNCEDIIALLKADFKIGKDLLYIIADEVENDVSLKAHFGLPREA